MPDTTHLGCQWSWSPAIDTTDILSDWCVDCPFTSGHTYTRLYSLKVSVVLIAHDGHTLPNEPKQSVQPRFAVKLEMSGISILRSPKPLFSAGDKLKRCHIHFIVSAGLADFAMKCSEI